MNNNETNKLWLCAVIIPALHNALYFQCSKLAEFLPRYIYLPTAGQPSAVSSLHCKNCTPNDIDIGRWLLVNCSNNQILQHLDTLNGLWLITILR